MPRSCPAPSIARPRNLRTAMVLEDTRTFFCSGLGGFYKDGEGKTTGVSMPHGVAPKVQAALCERFGRWVTPGTYPEIASLEREIQSTNAALNRRIWLSLRGRPALVEFGKVLKRGNLSSLRAALSKVAKRDRNTYAALMALEDRHTPANERSALVDSEIRSMVPDAPLTMSDAYEAALL